MGTATLSYNRNNTTTLEATDNKVMPKCRVVPEMGDEWNEGPKSYSSYNIAYQLRDMRLDAERSESHSMKIRVGMGINLRPAGSKKPLPQISFVNRNQVLIWVSDPTSKAQIRGIMVLMSSYLDNIRTEDELSIFEEEEIELGTGCLKVPKIKTKEEEPGTIALSIAQVEKQPGTGTNKLRAVVPSFITKFGQRPSVSPPTDISPHEYLARGWDANNNEWRRVLWPALDKDFRPADPGTAPVWKLQCPWTKGPATIGTN
ncbi:hypothetical protein B0H13DRAFT_2168596 [Mycena leptocephala]|nr:hypothetical protein B0H13DRAFT_2168596 [Mycena leptocephala]